MAKKGEIKVPSGQLTFEVKALVSFYDVLTSKDYKPGDVVNGWTYERARLYEGRGQVQIFGGPVVGPSEVK